MKKGTLEVLRVQSWVCAVRGFLLLEIWNTPRCKSDTINQHLGSIQTLRSSTNCLIVEDPFLVSCLCFNVHYIRSRAGFQVFCCCFGRLWWMWAERSIRQLMDAGIIIYGSPLRSFLLLKTHHRWVTVKHSSSTLWRESPGASISCCMSTVWHSWFKIATLKSAQPSNPSWLMFTA